MIMFFALSKISSSQTFVFSKTIPVSSIRKKAQDNLKAVLCERNYVFQNNLSHLKVERAARQHHCYSATSLLALNAKPKRGNVVDTYQTVSINCTKCRQRLFRYKKKNGTKSNLIKCFVERIIEDSCGVLQKQEGSGIPQSEYTEWRCPNCESQFARSATIKGLPALKLVGGKVRMTKK
jgi:DNA-directed RNA polymerase subunit RPC12/RpoP